MKRFAIILGLILSVLSVHVQAAPRSISLIDEGTGNGVAIWQLFDYGTLSYVLHAALLDDGTGTWGTPAVISDPTISARNPRVALNAGGSIAVIWQGEVSFPISRHILCGATYDTTLNAWNPPTVLSGPTETLISQEDHYVKISAGNKVSVTYISYDFFTGTEQLRGIFSPAYGVWAAPVNIDP